MKTSTKLCVILLIWVGITNCEKEKIIPETIKENKIGHLKGNVLKGKHTQHSLKATGSVEVIWKGKDKGSEMGNQPENLLAFFEFNAHTAINGKTAKGDVVFTITEIDNTLHREIKATVTDVLIDADLKKGWIIAQVVTDSKGCLGDGNGGHDSGCSDDHHTDGVDDGAEHIDHDGGCSHDDTDDGSTHDDSCSDDHSEDTPTDEGHEGGDQANKLSGKNCRLGQIIAIKVHDVGTPGINGDGITWKWFLAESENVPCIENISNWPHLCKKTIIAGNIVVHI